MIAGWHAVADILDVVGRRDDALAIRKFVAQMPPVRTEKQWMADQLLRSNERTREKEAPDRSR